MPTPPDTPPAATPSDRLPSRALVLSAVGVLLLGLWAYHWLASWKQGHLKHSPRPWLNRYEYFGIDFLHNYFAARHWANGGDPFREPFGDPIPPPHTRKLVYPPIVIPVFAWCALVDDPRTAVGGWMLALVSFATLGGIAAWKARRKLGLSDVPLSIVLAVVLINAPFAFALERGNYDLLVVPLVLTAVWGLNKRRFAGDALAGVCLALAVGLKAYPGVLVAGLVPLRRWRALACTLAFGAAFLAYRFDDLRVAADNLQALADVHDPETHYKDVIPDPEQRHPLPNTHSITASWYTVWAHTKLSALARIPSAVASGLICCSMFVWIAVLAYRCPNPAPALVPLALWAVALGTFVPKVANDYSLVFLPMAAAAVWDRRDPPAVHAALGFAVVVLQPVAFQLSPTVAFGAKVAAVIAVGWCLAARLKALAAHPAPAPESH